MFLCGMGCFNKKLSVFYHISVLIVILTCAIESKSISKKLVTSSSIKIKNKNSIRHRKRISPESPSISKNICGI